MDTTSKKFPFDFMECVETYPSGHFLRTSDIFFAKKLSYHSASASNAEYVGWANPGNGISASAWAIQMIKYNASGNITDILWADGDIKMNNVWDDRVTYTYS